MDQELSSLSEPSSPASAPAPASADEEPRPAVRRRRRPAQPDWIDAQLRSLYEAVAAEPLPPELQALVERLDQAAPARP